MGGRPRISLALDTVEEIRIGSLQHDASVRSLVLRAVRTARAGTPGAAGLFVIRRAATDARSLGHPREQSCALRVLDLALAPSSPPEGVAGALVEWAGLLEARSRLDEAAETLELAADFAPRDPELALHRARTERKRGRVAEARALYDRVAALADDEPGLALMAAVGRALTCDDVEACLGRALRRAVEAGVGEAAAVAQEERARARRARGDIPGALRDYLAAAARYHDPIDRGRVGHEVADLLVGARDLDGARAALLETERTAHPEQVALARARLQAIARTQGDELGVRRHLQSHAPSLVSLAPGRARARDGTSGPHPSSSRVLRRGLARIPERPYDG